MFGKVKWGSWPGVTALLGFLFFIYLHAVSFSLWFSIEDFGWLVWTDTTKFLSVLAPPAQSNYRPLAVNIPYFIFSKLTHGIFWWKMLGIAIAGLTARLFWVWMRELSGSVWVALALTMLWLFNPSMSFGMVYLNAFDYLLTPFFLLAFLVALRGRNFPLALLLFLLGSFTKELFYACPFFFLLWRRQLRIPGKWILLSVFASAGFLFLLKGFSLPGGKVAGLSVAHDPILIARHARELIRATFWGHQGALHWWFPFAWATMLLMLLAAARSGREARKAVGEFLASLAVFFGPLLLLTSVQSEDLGPFYWVLLFSAAAGGARFWVASLTAWRIAPAALAIVIGSCAYGWQAPGHRNFYAGMSNTYYYFVRAALPALNGCGKFDQVAVAGVDKIFERPMLQEFAVMALRWAQPGAVFFLVGPAEKVAPGNGRLDVDVWKSPAEAEKMPLLQFSLRAGRVIQVAWAPGRPGCVTSAEAIQPRIFSH